jgi:hypothetical protein
MFQIKVTYHNKTYTLYHIQIVWMMKPFLRKQMNYDMRSCKAGIILDHYGPKLTAFDVNSQ